jgi:hypothetical protein
MVIPANSDGSLPTVKTQPGRTHDTDGFCLKVETGLVKHPDCPKVKVLSVEAVLMWVQLSRVSENQVSCRRITSMEENRG